MNNRADLIPAMGLGVFAYLVATSLGTTFQLLLEDLLVPSGISVAAYSWLRILTYWGVLLGSLLAIVAMVNRTDGRPIIIGRLLCGTYFLLQAIHFWYVVQSDAWFDISHVEQKLRYMKGRNALLWPIYTDLAATASAYFLLLLWMFGWSTRVNN